MKFLTFSKIKISSSLFLLTISNFAGITQEAYANEALSNSVSNQVLNQSSTELVNFMCFTPDSLLPPEVEEADIFSSNFEKFPTIVALTRQYGVVKVLHWKNIEFKNSGNLKNDPIDYTPNKRCELVAQRLNDFYYCDILPNIVQDYIKSKTGKKMYPAIFASLDKTIEDKNKQIACLNNTKSQSSRQRDRPDLYLLFMLSQYDDRAINQNLCFVRSVVGDEIAIFDFVPKKTPPLQDLQVYDKQKCKTIIQNDRDSDD